MTPQAATALTALNALRNPAKGEEMAAYHKVKRPYLGVSNPEIDTLVRSWRKQTLDDRLAISKGLWPTNAHEARIAAAKCLDQTHIEDDVPVWTLITSWVPDFDAWAIADHACIAGQKRLVQSPDRLSTVEGWTNSSHLWTRRAALVITLPWARTLFEDIERRERILGWAARYTTDDEWFVQKAVAWWLRDLSKRDPDRTRDFLHDHGDKMKPFAKREAAKYLA